MNRHTSVYYEVPHREKNVHIAAISLPPVNNLIKSWMIH